jgi:hypothetical protein
MLIQSSELTARPGKGGALGTTVTAMRDVLARASGKDWYSWVALAGRPYGTYLLSTRSDDFAHHVNASMQIGLSPEWSELAATADGILANPAPSQLNEVIAVTGEPAAPKQFLTVTRSTLSGSDFGKSIAWACDVMEHVTKLSGHGGLVMSSVAGTMFQLFWVLGVDTPDELEASNKAIGSDAGYLEMISEAGSKRFFVEGSSDRVLLARMP